MKITEIRAYVMNVPAADGETPRRNWIFVEVETDAGVTGIGEATTEHHEMAVAAQVETALKPRLLGMDPTDVEQVWQLGVPGLLVEAGCGAYERGQRDRHGAVGYRGQGIGTARVQAAGW